MQIKDKITNIYYKTALKWSAFKRETRLKHGWYKHQCPDCKMIYERWSGKLLDIGDTYAFYKKDNAGEPQKVIEGLCKICYLSRLEEIGNDECPLCHKKSVYVADFDYLGDICAYKCKSCSVIFHSTYEDYNYESTYNRIFIHMLNGIKIVFDDWEKKNEKKLEKVDEVIKEGEKNV